MNDVAILLLQMQSQPDPVFVHHTVMAMAAILPIILLAIAAIAIPPYWMIFKKAGFSPWLSLLILLPVINIIMLWIIAFSTWRVVPAPEATWPSPFPSPPQPPQTPPPTA